MKRLTHKEHRFLDRLASKTGLMVKLLERKDYTKPYSFKLGFYLFGNELRFVANIYDGTLLSIYPCDNLPPYSDWIKAIEDECELIETMEYMGEE